MIGQQTPGNGTQKRSGLVNRLNAGGVTGGEHADKGILCQIRRIVQATQALTQPAKQPADGQPAGQQLLADSQTQHLLVEPLTRREQQVLQRIARGQNNQQLADALSVSTSTIKTHINNLFRKLGANERQQAIQIARSLKILP